MRQSRKTRGGMIAVLDIGTTKTACLIARIEAGGPVIAGFGQHASKGLKAGTIIDFEAAERSVLHAVNEAEEMAEQTIERVIVNVSGGNPASRLITQDIPLGGKEINDNDLRRVLEPRHSLNEPADRTILHTIPISYTIDGSRGVRDPRGMVGDRLGANIHLVSTAVTALRNLKNCIARCHLEIETMVVSPLAAGYASLVEDERDLGVTLIDMGGGVTSLALFYDGALLFTDSVPIGGQYVTSDIARGLSTPLVHAERLKTLHGAAIVATADEREMIEVPLVAEENPAHSQQIPKSILTGIIQPRLEETFELVKARLSASGLDHLTGRRVVLTGGASQLNGIQDLAGKILDKDIRMSRPPALPNLPEQAMSPAFATALGLIRYAIAPAAEPVRRSSRNLKLIRAGMFGRFGFWLKENF